MSMTTTMIQAIDQMSVEEREHLAFENMIGQAVLDNRMESALKWMKMELVLTQTGESL